MVTVRNTSSRLVTLRLNSGQTLILAPGTSVEKIMDQDVERNAKVKKLVDLGVIAIPEMKPSRAKEPGKAMPGKKAAHAKVKAKAGKK